MDQLYLLNREGPSTVISAEQLQERILKKSIMRGGVGKGYNTKQVVNPITNPVNVINLPGNGKMNDLAFFNQPNPFDDMATVRFKSDLFDDYQSFGNKQNAFPQQTYYQNVLVNDANDPIIFEPAQFIKAQLPDFNQLAVERKQVQMEKRLSSTMLFPEQTQNINPFL